MKPLFTKNLRERLSASSKSRGYDNNMMIPLSGSDGPRTPNYRDKMNKNSYMVGATSKYGTGTSDEHMVSEHGGIEYEREFTVEEQYIGDSHVFPK